MKAGRFIFIFAFAALYNTLLHTTGTPRPHFNLTGEMKDDPTQRGPLRELLV